MKRRAALAPLLAVTFLWGCTRPLPELQGAVLVVLDTLRADHVSSYGYERETTPALDALAGEGVLFETAVSNSSHTLPSTVALLSGRLPTAEVYDRRFKFSLVEALRDAGLHTAAFTEGGFFSRFYGLDRGFRSYSEEEGAVRLYTGSGTYHEEARGGPEHTFAEARAWLSQRGAERFFLVVHTYEVHTPYRRREWVEDVAPGVLGETFEIADVSRVRQGRLRIGAAEGEYLRGLYDGGVQAADRLVGELLGSLAELGLDARTLVVVTSDHGEELGARFPRWAGDHAHALYDELVHVPLIFRDPRQDFPERRVTHQVRSIDVLPTVLDLLGVPLPPVAEGRSLVPMMRGEERAGRPALSRLPTDTERDSSQWALRNGRYKLILNPPRQLPPRPLVELFDLERDPGERENLATRDAELVHRLRAELEHARARWKAEGPADYEEPEPVPDALKQRLESLGYAD